MGDIRLKRLERRGSDGTGQRGFGWSEVPQWVRAGAPVTETGWPCHVGEQGPERGGQ